MMRKALPAVALVAAACGGGDRPAPAAAPPAPASVDAAAPAPPPAASASVVRGIALFSPTMSFRPCSGPIATLVDSTGNRLRPLIGLVGSSEEQGVFILGLGSTSPRNELVLHEVDYVVRPAPGEGCERPEQAYSIAVQGVDSAWRVTIAPGGIEYHSATGSEHIRFPAAAPAEADGSSTYTSSTEFGDSRNIRIVLTSGSCREIKSGAWTALRASVTLDGRALQGCAWRGLMR